MTKVLIARLYPLLARRVFVNHFDRPKRTSVSQEQLFGVHGIVLRSSILNEFFPLCFVRPLIVGARGRIVDRIISNWK